MLSLTFSMRSNSKTEQMVHGTIAAVEWKNGGELARVASGLVGWTLFFTWLDPSLTSFFFRSTVTNAPFTLHFVLPYDRLAQAMLSINKPKYVNKLLLLIFSSSQ